MVDKFAGFLKVTTAVGFNSHCLSDRASSFGCAVAQGKILGSSSLFTFGGNLAVHVEAFSIRRIVSFWGSWI